MVLQRGAINTVWGKATPGQKVTVLFKNQRSESVAHGDSSWQVYLAPESAGGPFTLSIIGKDTLRINDILIGEVWLGSGQSNMEWSVQQSAHAEREIKAADYPNIRLFTVARTISGRPTSHIPSDGWKRTTPENTASFSAVAYYFGRTLHDSLDVPIGLIHSSWGGTPAEAWTSTRTLREMDDFVEPILELERHSDSLDALTSSFPARMDAWLTSSQEEDAGYTTPSDWSTSSVPDASWPSMEVPALWNDVLPGFDGTAWLRKTFDLPSDWTGAEVTLHLAMIDDVDITWVNGVEVGRTYLYNQERKYTIPPSVLREGSNTIAIRVLDTGGGGGIWGEASDVQITRSDNDESFLSLAGSWRYQIGKRLSDFEQAPPRQPALHHTPGVLYNAMIHPLIPYRIKGVIWYQGESNAGRAYQYRDLFPAMITDWRSHWDNTFDFHFVQLANFMPVQQNPVELQTWPELREAQTMALSLPNTGMAVTIDIGEADDIHPRNKQDVGYRLALNALYTSYDRPIVYSGPMYKEMRILADTVAISFDHVGSGLTTPDNEMASGFAIAGNDLEFHWADAIIRDNTVLVYSDKVTNPVAVRYGWADNPTVNLYNQEGLPASPFRTDDWPSITMGRR